MTTTFGRFEVSPVKTYRDKDNNLCVETCEEKDAEFFGVYVRQKRPPHIALIVDDRDTRFEAEEFAKKLHEKDN